MRISTSTMTNLVSGTTSGAYEKYYEIMKKFAQGKNFTKASEDIVGASNLLKVNDEISKLTDYQSNIEAASSEMSLAYDTLNSVNDEVDKIKSLILEASNATTTPDSAKAISSEIKERVNSIKGYMNTKYMDNYIFSGNNVQMPTYTTDANGDVIYQGSASGVGDRNLTISEGKTMAYNVTGDKIFPKTTVTNADGSTSEVDFFSQMKELDELLNADTLDYDAIRKKIDVATSAYDNVTVEIGNFSAKVSKLESAKSLNQSTLTTLAEKKSDIEDIDIVKAATDLKNAQTSLQASYTISNVILGGMSLLDYL